MSILLYYVTRNGHLGTLELPTFESCVPIPEDLIFVAYRDGINFVKEPPTKFPFSDVERLIMGSEFFDMRYLKDSDYRNQNTQLCPIFGDSNIYVDFITFPTDISEARIYINNILLSTLNKDNFRLNTNVVANSLIRIEVDFITVDRFTYQSFNSNFDLAPIALFPNRSQQYIETFQLTGETFFGRLIKKEEIV